MTIATIIPVKAGAAVKSRLARILQPEDRQLLTRLMLDDVLDAVISQREVWPLVVTADRSLIQELRKRGIAVVHEDRPRGVNAAVAEGVQVAQARGVDASLILPADLPLITREDVRHLLRLAPPEPCVVLSPALGLRGTNALLRRPHDVIDTSYDQRSFSNHYRAARRTRAALTLYLSPRIQLDIDTPVDLERLLAYDSDSRTSRFLRKLKLERTFANAS